MAVILRLKQNQMVEGRDLLKFQNGVHLISDSDAHMWVILDKDDDIIYAVNYDLVDVCRLVPDEEVE